MNILYLIRPFSTQGGVQSYVYNMARALATQGHHIHVLTATGPGDWDFKGFEDRILVHRINFVEQPFRGYWRLEEMLPLNNWRYSRAVAKALPALIKQYAIDIIEACDWDGDVLEYLPQRRVPVCVRLHGFPGIQYQSSRDPFKKRIKTRLLSFLLQKQISKVDLITSVSHYYKGLAVEHWKLNGNGIQIIPIGIDSKRYFPVKDNIKELSVLFVGRLQVSKGIDVLDQSIPLILKKIPQMKFYFAGPDLPRQDTGEYWSQYLINRYGNKTIIYLNQLPPQALVPYYQKAEVCVSPSVYEAGGMVAIEAMACGCCVVATQTGGLLENIRNNETGLLVPVGDSVALAQAVLRIFNEEALRQRLKENALEYVRQRFDLEQTAKNSLEAYADTISHFKQRGIK